MPDGDVLLEVDDLAVNIGRTAVLHEVRFQVPTGGATAILGPNGAGKTTLLRTISGILQPRRGAIRLAGEGPIQGRKPWEILRLGIAHVPQGRRVFAPLTVYDNLRVGGYSRPKEWQQEAERVLSVFPVLRTKMKARAGSLSGGQQQMLAIARALMSKPRILLLDEPSLGLSPLYVQEMSRMLRNLCASEGLTVVLVEQNLAVVQAVADHYFLLRTGRMVSEATPVKDLDDNQIAAAYLQGE